MREHDEDWDKLPLSPDVRRYIDAATRYSLEERRLMLRFAPVLCRCRTWYDWRYPGPPQEDCVIHTTIMFDRKGDWL